MFYYYQIRNRHYKTEAVPAVTCPLCGTRGQMQMSILQKYTWMVGPMAPSGKYAIAWCENCDKYIPRVKWTDEMDTEYVQLKQGLKTPRRLFRGLWVMPLIMVVFIGGIILFVNARANNSKKDQAYVLQATLQPRVGDIFQVVHSEGGTVYNTYFKVSRVDTDSVYIQEANVPVPDMKEWDKVPTEASAYQPQIQGFSLESIRHFDGMFSVQQDNTYVAGLVFGVYRDGELHKKY